MVLVNSRFDPTLKVIEDRGEVSLDQHALDEPRHRNRVQSRQLSVGREVEELPERCELFRGRLRVGVCGGHGAFRQRGEDEFAAARERAACPDVAAAIVDGVVEIVGSFQEQTALFSESGGHERRQVFRDGTGPVRREARHYDDLATRGGLVREIERAESLQFSEHFGFGNAVGVED